MMNQITIEGTGITDPYEHCGRKPPISFTLETTHSYTTESGQPKENKFRFKVKCLFANSLFTFIKEYIKKGLCIRITGTLQSEEDYYNGDITFINPETITLLPNEKLQDHLELCEMKQEGKYINLTPKDFIKNGFHKGYSKYRVAFSCPCCKELFEYNSNELTFDVDATCKHCNNGFHIHASE